jgi:hypothetical protein
MPSNLIVLAAVPTAYIAEQAHISHIIRVRQLQHTHAAVAANVVTAGEASSTPVVIATSGAAVGRVSWRLIVIRCLTSRLPTPDERPLRCLCLPA